MSDDGTPDLDTLFGFEEMQVGSGDLQPLRVRVLLTRKQVRASTLLYQRMAEAHKKFVALMERAETATGDELVTITQEGEEAEDELSDICIRGLKLLCIDPPVAALEQLQVIQLAGLLGRANAVQAEAAVKAITGQTGHPTSASSGS